MPPEPLAPNAPLAERVIAWQQLHGRHDLPWQGTRDPYRVWLSEVMLQQTQVATVRAYYARFLLRFPDVQALAQAPLDDVLALWSGLGYYSRARNLHRCAQTVCQVHGGRFPDTSQALAALPGIGRSTAAAIAAFCFGERAAILDGNVRRVLARALGFDGDLASASEVSRLWRLAEDLLPVQAVDRYTQGLMDLGATVCLTRQPSCGLCPLQADCVARSSGRPERWPVRSRRLKRGTRHLTLLWLQQGDAVWLVQRPPQGVWAGLWSLPEWPDEDALAAQVAGWPGEGERLPQIKHVLTHLDLFLTPLHWRWPARLSAARQRALLAALDEGPAQGLVRGPGQWVALDALAAKGLPAPVRQLLQS
jgi:A/G-specific adenine glycosylase